MKQYHEQRATAVTAPYLWHCLFGIVGFFPYCFRALVPDNTFPI